MVCGAESASRRRNRVRPLCEPLEDRLAPAVDAYIYFAGTGHDATVGESKPDAHVRFEITDFHFGELRVDLGPTSTFDPAKSTRTAPGMTYQVPGQPGSSHYVDLDISIPNAIPTFTITPTDEVILDPLLNANNGIGNFKIQADTILFTGPLHIPGMESLTANEADINGNTQIAGLTANRTIVQNGVQANFIGVDGLGNLTVEPGGRVDLNGNVSAGTVHVNNGSVIVGGFFDVFHPYTQEEGLLVVLPSGSFLLQDHGNVSGNVLVNGRLQAPDLFLSDFNLQSTNAMMSVENLKATDGRANFAGAHLKVGTAVEAIEVTVDAVNANIAASTLDADGGSQVQVGPNTLGQFGTISLGGQSAIIILPGGIVDAPRFTLEGGSSLLDNGKVIGDVKNTSGTVSGSGLVIGNLFNNGSVIPFGLTITGNLTLGEDSVLRVTLDNHPLMPKLIVQGMARLDGKLVVSANAPVLLGQDYEIMTYGSANDTFDAVQTVDALQDFVPQLNYKPEAFLVKLTQPF
jgi:hypothetical protein